LLETFLILIGIEEKNNKNLLTFMYSKRCACKIVKVRQE